MDTTALLFLLHHLGIPHTVHEHAPVMTVAESARLRAAIPGMTCKCLFLRSKDGRFWLAAAPAAMRVDLKALQRELGCSRLSFADAGEMLALLGVTPGAATLFAAVNDTRGEVTLVMEKSLLEADLFCFHPLVNTATVSLAPEGMLKFLAHTGHAPVIVKDMGLPPEKA